MVTTRNEGRGFARRLAEADRCQFGTWVKLPTLETVEMIADAGFDFIVIDQEHAPLTFEAAYRTIALGQALGLQVLARVPDRSGSHLQRLLDCGIDGILVPRVDSVEVAQAVLAQMVFSPRGERGLGPTSRAGGWGSVSRDDYLKHGDENVMHAVQLEDRDVLEQVERIVELPGLNGVFLGAGDLSLSSGLPATAPEISALVDRMLAVTTQAGIPCGTAVPDAERALAAADSGFRYVMINNDASIFRAATAAIVRGVREGLGSPGSSSVTAP